MCDLKMNENVAVQSKGLTSLTNHFQVVIDVMWCMHLWYDFCPAIKFLSGFVNRA